MEIEEKVKKVGKWKNRERVLVFCSRGVSHRDRHLMQDFRDLLPHSKAESKRDKNQSIKEINEICEMRNCSKSMYFECKKKKDLYLWVSSLKGPCAKFLVHNVHTMGEMKLSGNCLKGSRPLLSFDSSFKDEESPHLQLLQELLIQTLGTPRYHPRSQPFLDHIFNFSMSPDGKIWFRNYQVVDEEGRLEEIGPRLVLEPIRIYEGSYGGEIIYENPEFLSPNLARRRIKEASGTKYIQRVQAKKSLEQRREAEPEIAQVDPLEAVFDTAADPDQEQPEAKRIKKDLSRKSTKRKKRKLSSN